MLPQYVALCQGGKTIFDGCLSGDAPVSAANYAKFLNSVKVFAGCACTIQTTEKRGQPVFNSIRRVGCLSASKLLQYSVWRLLFQHVPNQSKKKSCILKSLSSSSRFSTNTKIKLGRLRAAPLFLMIPQSEVIYQFGSRVGRSIANTTCKAEFTGATPC